MRRSLLAAVLVALVTAGSALAGNAGFAPVDPKSPNAERINDSYLWIALFAGAILLVVHVALIMFIVRYRRRNRPRTQDGAQVHGNTNLEIAWTIAPVILVAAIGSFIFYKLPGIQDIPAASADGGRTEVVVKGYRFYWNYTYENGVIQVDRMRAPAGGNVRLEITAAAPDVIHSWWIPALGGKFDAIPGHVNETWFNAAEPGTYKGQCGEFCGIQHAVMKAAVEVMPRDEFEQWLEAEARAQENGTSDLGEQTYIGACAKCHGLDGEGDIGPPLRNNALVGDADAIEGVVRQGRGEMPRVGPDWTERQMDALTEYLAEEFAGGS